MTKHLTVVYTINDDEAFEAKREEIFNSYHEYDPSTPPAWGVSAVSQDNEILRVEKIERALEQFDNLDAVELAQHWIEATGFSR